MERSAGRFTKIPAEYLSEYLAQQAALIKSRLRLFCMLVLGMYFGVTVIGFIQAPEEIKPEEIPLWIFLAASGLLILYLNRKARGIRLAKANAYLFTALLLIILTRVNMIYYEYADYSASLYLFMLFLVCFTIPWRSLDVVPITLMHVLAFSFFFLYLQRYVPVEARPDFDLQSYSDGLIFLSMGFILCWIIRKKETSRDAENFVLLKEIEKKNEQMQRELELATRVQKTLIPKSMATELVDVAVMYLPMYYIGGDYAKFHFIDKERLIFIICDVTGHGVSAALLVNRIHAEFVRFAGEAKEPGLLLKELNDFIVRDFAGINMYLSAFCCMLDFKTMKMTYSNHGHPSQYLYRVTDSVIERLDPQATLLGIFDKDEELYQKEVDFRKGDRILLFTDGIIETKRASGEEYGRERLEGFIRKNHGLDVDMFNRNLLDELNGFKKGDFEDDIFMLNIYVKESGHRPPALWADRPGGKVLGIF